MIQRNHWGLSIYLADDRDEEAAVQSILFDNASIFNSPQKRSGGAANRVMVTIEDFDRRVEEEVQRRLREQLENTNHLAGQALKDSNSMSQAHRDHRVELDDRWEGQASVVEKENVIASNIVVSPVMRTSKPFCKSPRCHSENYAPRRSSRSPAQQNLEHWQCEGGSQLSFIHAQAESTRHLRTREFQEGPLVLQAQRSIKGKALSEGGRDKARDRLNKSIKIAIENEGHNRHKLRFRLSGGWNPDD